MVNCFIHIAQTNSWELKIQVDYGFDNYTFKTEAYEIMWNDLTLKTTTPNIPLENHNMF